MHISVAFTYDKMFAEHLAEQWKHVAPVKRLIKVSLLEKICRGIGANQITAENRDVSNFLLPPAAPTDSCGLPGTFGIDRSHFRPASLKSACITNCKSPAAGTGF